MVSLSASILGCLDKKIMIESINCSSVDYLHVDVQDGTISNGISKYTEDELKSSKKRLDVHIMAEDVTDLIKQYVQYNPAYITIHCEIERVKEAIELIKSYGIKVGLAIQVETDIDEIINYLDDIDLVLIMGVELGSSGACFNDVVLSKLEKIVSMKNNYHYVVSVDGGINDSTVQLLPSGLDILVSGSYLTKDLNEGIKVLKAYE